MNKIWYNQAMIYFHKYRDSGKFPKEFNYIRRNIGILKCYNKINKNNESMSKM